MNTSSFFRSLLHLTRFMCLFFFNWYWMWHVRAIPEGVTHNSYSPFHPCWFRRKQTKQKPTRVSCGDLLVIPQMLAFAAMPQCWSTETGFLWNCQQHSPNASTVFSMREKNVQVLQKCTMCLRKWKLFWKE